MKELKIVTNPKHSFFDIIFGIIPFIISLIFFFYGVASKNTIFCLSLIFGILWIWFFNLLTNFKFSTNRIKENLLINFTEIGIEFQKNKVQEIVNWEKISDVEIDISTYKNQSADDEGWTYDGTDNFIKFKTNNIEEKTYFLIDSKKQLEEVQRLFETDILPILYKDKKIKNESIIISKLKFEKLQDFKKENGIKSYIGKKVEYL